MVDYYPVLQRAVAALDPNTKETRRAIYDRARQALVDGLRSSDPTLSDTDLKTQSHALEAAIRRVEGEALREAMAPPPPPEPPAEEQPADEGYADRPPLEEGRSPIRLIVGVAASLVVLLGVAGAATYMFWPGPKTASAPPAQRGGPAKRAEPEAAGGAAYVYLRQPVYYRTNHPVGTVVVDKQQSFLYVVRPSLSALRYGIGVGNECATAGGLYQIVRKEEWPGLKVPSGKQLTDEERSRNPFGARALYLSKEPRIHGTNVPASIGRPGSVGCFRLTNDDIIHLYDRVPLETRVIVVN